MRQELAQRSLTDFGAAVYPNFVTPRHILKLAETLEAVERGDIRRLIVQFPPRHGKSTLTSQLLPAWYLGRNPNRRIIACSYSVDLAWEFSRKARNTVASPEYASVFPNIALSPDARAVGQWELCNPHDIDAHGQPARYQGGYVSAGVGGGITGKGAHLALIDDPVKNAEEAASKTVLEAHWNWYTSTLYTRLEGEGAIIVIMTRWAEGDLAGRLIDAMRGDGSDQWTVLNMPALAEDDDILGREADEALWPEKYDVDELARIRTTIGSRDFTALYQQRPSPIGGAVFRRDWMLNRYTGFDRGGATQVIQVWDTAFKAKTSNDYSVCATWALVRNNAYLVDVFRERVEFPVLKRKARDLYEKWHPHAVLVEDRASGQSLVQELKHETKIPVIAMDIEADKLVRANAITPYFESERVWLPQAAPWLDEWIEEHAGFPNGAHDDQVDTTSMALRRLFFNDGPAANRVAVSAPRPIVSSYQPR